METTVWRRRYWLGAGLLLVLGIGALLRVTLISGYRFHPDEALYATWARLIATGKDLWLAQQLVDKPPLNLYILAGLFGTLGASEEIARIPNILFSLASIALLYDIATALYCETRDRRATWKSSVSSVSR